MIGPQQLGPIPVTEEHLVVVSPSGTSRVTFRVPSRPIGYPPPKRAPVRPGWGRLPGGRHPQEDRDAGQQHSTPPGEAGRCGRDEAEIEHVPSIRNLGPFRRSRSRLAGEHRNGRIRMTHGRRNGVEFVSCAVSLEGFSRVTHGTGWGGAPRRAREQPTPACMPDAPRGPPGRGGLRCRTSASARGTPRPI